MDISLQLALSDKKWIEFLQYEKLLLQYINLMGIPSSYHGKNLSPY